MLWCTIRTASMCLKATQPDRFSSSSTLTEMTFNTADYIDPAGSEQTSTQSNDKPFRALLSALIDDLFLVRDSSTMTGARKRQRERDCMWVQSDAESPFSFLWVCNHLGLAPEQVRRQYFSTACRRAA